MTERKNPCRHFVYHPLPEERQFVVDNFEYARRVDPAMVPVIMAQLQHCSYIEDAGLYNFKKYVVQYEVEFDDALSVNDVVEIWAASEYDAMDQFDKNDDLKNSILAKHPGSMCVTSNAAWDE